MSDNKIQLFSHEQFGTVRVIMKDGEPWFVASDIAKALGYVKPANAIAEHCKKAIKSTITLNQGDGKITPPVNVLLIPETDVYRLVMRSNLPTAEAFQDWVCEDVLPSIRKTGSYIGGIALPDFSDPASAARAWAEQYEAKVKAQRESEERLKALALTSEALAVTTKELSNTTSAKAEAIETAEYAYQHQHELDDRRAATAMGRNGGYVKSRNEWMGKAKKAESQCEELRDELGNSKNWKTVKAIPWLHNAFKREAFTGKESNTFYMALGKMLSKISAMLGKEKKQIPDTVHGKVNCYHIDVINYAGQNLIDFCRSNPSKWSWLLTRLSIPEFWEDEE